MTAAELASQAAQELASGGYQAAQVSALVSIALSLSGTSTHGSPESRSADDPAGGNDALSPEARVGIERIRCRWTTNGVLAREGFPEGLMAYGHITTLLEAIDSIAPETTHNPDGAA